MCAGKYKDRLIIKYASQDYKSIFISISFLDPVGNSSNILDRYITGKTQGGQVDIDNIYSISGLTLINILENFIYYRPSP